ncbi:MAG TPA: ABC transporter permease subunit [Candidatus Dormibacteraeota bacterium]|nr:ABC transporter permease subunit [Candidatus Dormibacteraeota bacterium]
MNLALLIGIAGGALLFLTADSRIWPATRVLVRFCFQTAAVLAVAWLLVTLAANSNAAVTGGTGQTSHDSVQHIVSTVAAAAQLSLWLIALAIVFGTGAGLLGAIVVTRQPMSGLRFAGVLSTAVWVLPTFMVAILAQELQALFYEFTGQRISAAYAQINALSVFWAVVVLGIRPAAYVYRQARVALSLEATADHVRAARSRGLPERVVSTRYIVRPSSTALLASWLNSIRVVVGALPLVEFFFGFPGVGSLLLLSLGLHDPGTAARPDPDLAIASALALGVLLLLLESIAIASQLLLDPRLRELRTA